MNCFFNALRFFIEILSLQYWELGKKGREGGREGGRGGREWQGEGEEGDGEEREGGGVLVTHVESNTCTCSI